MERWIDYIELDEDRYPNPWGLVALMAEEFDARSSARLLVDLAGKEYPVVYAPALKRITDEYGRDIHVVNLSTGGWSGCEETMAAVMNRADVTLIHWYQSTAGGHYEFHIPSELVE